MQADPQHGRPELFLVRKWEKRESNSPSDSQTDDSRAALYGMVQHTVSGRTRSFTGWDGLNVILLEMLQTLTHHKRR
jgi:hypothetical protein